MVRCSARLSVSLAAAFVATSLFADVSWYWSNTQAGEEGPYDLADETLWKNGWFPAYGGGTVSTITNAVIGPVQNVTRTFTLSKDISVRGFTLGEAHQYKATTIFDLGKDRTLNIFGGTDAGFWFCGNYSKYQTFILKSGTLKSLPNAKKNTFRFNAYGHSQAIIDGPDAKLDMGQITFGAVASSFVITNGAYAAGKFYVGGSTGEVFRVTGSDPVSGRPSTFNQNKEWAYACDGANTFYGREYESVFPRFIVDNGAVVSNFQGSLPNRGHCYRTIVDNATFKCSNETSIGATGSPTDNCFTLDHGAEMKSSSYLKIGCASGVSNRVEVLNDSDYNVLYTFVGYEAKNRFSSMMFSNVCSGVQTYAAQYQQLWIGGKCDGPSTTAHGARLDIIDCDWGKTQSKRNDLQIIHGCGRDSYSNTVVITRSKVHIHRRALPRFNSDNKSTNSWWNVFKLDASELTYTGEQGAHLAGYGTCFSEFHIDNGSFVHYGTNSASLAIGGGSAACPCISNLVSITGRSTLEVATLAVGTNGNRLVIDDSTVRLYKKMTTAADARILVKGAAPKLEWPALVDGQPVQYHTTPLTGAETWRFVLSPTAYATPFFDAKNVRLEVSDATKFEFDCSEVEEGGDYPLFRSTYQLVVSDAQLARMDAAVKATLKDGYVGRVFVRNGVLYARVGPRKGMTLIIR